MLKYKTGRLTGLDILRAVAILLVLFRHAPILPSGSNIFIKFILDGLHRGGWVGVDLFFVLSGFLVSGLIFREVQQYNTFSIKNFVFRRALRIYPPFYLLIALTPLLLSLKNLPPFTIKVGYLCEIFYFQNYCGGIWGHTWSLAVEEHFYIFLPWLLFTLLLIKPKRQNHYKAIPFIFLFIAFICLIGRLIVNHKSPSEWYNTLNPTHLRLDSLMAGVVVSYFYHLNPAYFLEKIHPYRIWICILGIILLSPAFIFPLETTWYIPTIGLTVFYIASSCLLISLLGLRKSETKIIKIFGFIGIYSYSIYLWHRSVELWLLPKIDKIVIPNLSIYSPFLIYFIGAILLGIIMGFLVEIPILKYREKLIPRKSHIV